MIITLVYSCSSSRESASGPLSSLSLLVHVHASSPYLGLCMFLIPGTLQSLYNAMFGGHRNGLCYIKE